MDIDRDLTEPTFGVNPELVKQCRDAGASTAEAKSIYMTSRRIAESIVGNSTLEDKVRQRCVVATGDPQFHKLLVFKNEPMRAGLAALRHGATIFTDIRMVREGIQRHGHTSDVVCVLDGSEELAAREEITRTSAGFLTYSRSLHGSIVVIGNAPSALITVCKLIDRGICPALVIATPVGFVNAAYSKQMLRERNVPSITTRGTRGGTPVAVAATNEIIALFSQGGSQQ
ncbi:MAG: precorrin-8X methylmutase [Methermicoccaceae archaeon]